MTQGKFYFSSDLIKKLSKDIKAPQENYLNTKLRLVSKMKCARTCKCHSDCVEAQYFTGPWLILKNFDEKVLMKNKKFSRLRRLEVFRNVTFNKYLGVVGIVLGFFKKLLRFYKIRIIFIFLLVMTTRKN